MSIGRPPLDPKNRQFGSRCIDLGPFQVAATAGYAFLVASGNTLLNVTTDVDAEVGAEFLDGVQVRCVTKPSIACNMRLAYKTSGQTMADAVTAGQHLTDTFDLNGLTNEVPSSLTISTDATGLPYNRIPPDSQLFMTLSANPTALVGLNIRLELSSYPG